MWLIKTRNRIGFQLTPQQCTAMHTDFASLRLPHRHPTAHVCRDVLVRKKAFLLHLFKNLHHFRHFPNCTHNSVCERRREVQNDMQTKRELLTSKLCIVFVYMFILSSPHPPTPPPPLPPHCPRLIRLSTCLLATRFVYRVVALMLLAAPRGPHRRHFVGVGHH